ncbi:MAG TPA: hypothetical protein ENN65_09240 [Candidatus Hydrogenedentes bacterium]|nr:hypothetical protein [Candidatus Hydrogenedentota bacterium]
MFFSMLALMLSVLAADAENADTVGSHLTEAVSGPATDAPAADQETKPASVPQMPPLQPAITGAPATMRSPQHRIITNYWRHLNDILSAEAAKPPRDERRMNVRYPPPRSFPFDALQHLTCRDLLRAAHEGIREARRGDARRSSEEIDLQVAVNVATALEYYPLLAAYEEDLIPLFHHIENVATDPVMRVFLIRRCVAGVAPQSLFSLYLQEGVQRNRQECRRFLLKLATDPLENPAVQIAAMEVCYEFLHEEFCEALAKDVAAIEWAAARNVPVTPLILKAEDAPNPASITQVGLDRVGSYMQDFAAALVRLLDPSANRPPEVHEAVRALARRMDQEFPLKDPSVIQHALAAAADANS